MPRISARSAATIRRKFLRGINAALLQTSEDVLARNEESAAMRRLFVGKEIYFTGGVATAIQSRLCKRGKLQDEFTVPQR